MTFRSLEVSNNIVFKINHVKANYPNDDKYKKYVEKRKFYSSNQSYDFVGYVQTGIANKPVYDFVKYVANNEKSKGIFGKNSLYSPQEIKSLRNTLSTTQSPIWHGFISFEEVFGKTYCNDVKEAQEFFNKQFPRFLSQTGFDIDNITYFAGLHENTEHRHIHFSFFENKPTRYKSKDKELHFSDGKINKQFIEKAKVDFELFFLTTANKIKELRNNLTNSTRTIFEKDITFYPKLARKMDLLSRNLPEDGRLGYDSENMLKLKNDVDNITTCLIRNRRDICIKELEFESQLRQQDIEIARICKENKMKPNKYLLFDKYKDDLYRRLGNIVIQTALKIRTREIEKQRNLASARFQKMQRKNKLKYLIEQSLYLSEKISYETIHAFEEYEEKLRKYERQIQREMNGYEMY